VAELTGEGVSLVENIMLGRQPQPHLDAVYFITPSLASVAALVADFSGGGGPGAATGGKPLYRKAHVFFSSPVPPAQLTVGPHNPPLNLPVCSSCGILCPTAAAAAAAAAALLVAAAQGPGPHNVPLSHLNLNCFVPDLTH